LGTQETPEKRKRRSDEVPVNIYQLPQKVPPPKIEGREKKKKKKKKDENHLIPIGRILKISIIYHQMVRLTAGKEKEKGKESPRGKMRAHLMC